ncbi:MAG: YebC/PmpR family DNA-binding transcriptional regulator [Candidatus Gracilibacteria bacterium]|nr:YebC/PmpR family DNA-binding transcriptional regulator [Candidatus Gracilibacteria bacterium]MDD2909039.1 YebC/PmpR family DNA-binding transcriptional regulator [Candidatus Gracilibacteria bacterium]
MGRGPVIERKRNISNALKGKAFTIHAKLITLAAQKGGDPDKNPTLFDVIEKARKANVPTDNIARAIRKGTGEDKSGLQIMELYYEGFAVGGVGIIAKSLTDNKNRTSSAIRHIFSKYGGNLGETGSVSSFGFKFMGVIYLELKGKKLEELEEIIIESGAEDYLLEDEEILKILTQKQDLAQVANYLKNKNLSIESFGLEYVPNNFIEITDFDKALKIIKLIEDLEEDEDIEKVWYNYSIPDELQDQVIDALEKAKFRT